MLSILPHLRGDVVVKVARILGMMEFRTVWRGVPVNILPVNAAEPGMCLQSSIRNGRLSIYFLDRGNLP